MNNLYKDIEFVLNNEKGGPNVDQACALMAGFILTAGIFVVGRAIYKYYYQTPVVPTIEKEGIGEQTIVVGYRK